MAAPTNNNNNNNNNNESSRTFITLPTELIAEITTLLELSDLASLVQTARRFYSILTPTINRAALNRVFRDGTTVLQWAASRGLARLANALLELDSKKYTAEQYKSTLESAAQQGLRSTVELLFQKAAGELHPVEDGWKPLHWAASAGHVPVARFLIDIGIDPYTVQKRGYNPMHGVAARGDLEMAQLLLDAGVTVSREVSRYGRTSIHYAAAAGHKRMVELLLRAGANISSVDVHRRNVLFNAAVAGIYDRNVGSKVVIPAPGVGNAEVVKLFISLGVDSSLLDIRGMSVLHAVCEKGYVAELNTLIDGGVDLAIRDLAGFAPLHHAAYAGHKQVVDILLAAGADISAKDYHGRTVLHIAALAGQQELAKLLLSKAADLSSIRDSDGWTPLHHAAYEAHQETFDLLFQANDNNQFSPPAASRNPLTLHRAVEANSTPMIDFLIKSGVSLSTPKNDWTPLDVAIANDHAHIVNLLLTHGVDPNIAPEDTGYAPLQRACEHGNDQVVRLLLDAGADVSRGDADGSTPLHSASVGGHLGIVKRLIASGAPLNPQDSLLSTPLHDTVDEQEIAGQNDVAQFLVEKGADLSAVDNVGNTVLHVAAWAGREELIGPLETAGADPERLNQDGDCAYDILRITCYGF